MKSALIQFSVENFLSFKDRVTFSMEASWTSIPETYFDVLTSSYWIKVFKSGFIFGSNASGKTNVLKVLQFIDNKIDNSHSDEKRISLSTRPFLFDIKTQNMPSFFETIFLSNNKIYKYNFSILWDEVIGENLFQVLTKREKRLFSRNKQNFDFYEDFINDQNLKDVAEHKTKSYSLFISAAKEWIQNDTISEIADFFKKSLSSICVLKENYWWYTMERLFNNDGNFKNKVLEYLRMADFCIDDVFVDMKTEDIDNDGLKIRKRFKVEFEYPVFDNWNKVSNIKLNLLQESLGTEAFFKVLWPIIDTLENWNILLVDELNASLHPYLCKFLIDLFNNPETNPNNAQLIGTLHDTTLLDYSDEFNKWQIWFTERNKHGATDLFSLSDFDIRNWDKNYQAKYLNGRFGAVPFIHN